MAQKKRPEDLSVGELRRLLMEKQRETRQKRLESYQRTGRTVLLAPVSEAASLEDLRTSVVEREDEKAPAPWRASFRRFLNAFLLIVEIGAVFTLAFVLFNGMGLIRELNSEVSAAMEMPEITPTPLVVAVVLPSGHTPPTDPGGARFNDAEIPAHLRPQVQSMAVIALPTPGPEQAIRIQIPALGVDAPIVMGDGWEQLKKGVGQHIGSANPGKKGNLVLAAHNDIYGEIFRYLDKLQGGDQIIVYTNYRSYTYIVTETKLVDPYAVEVMAPTPNETATLISCYPYLVDNQRIVIHALLQDG